MFKKFLIITFLTILTLNGGIIQIASTFDKKDVLRILKKLPSDILENAYVEVKRKNNKNIYVIKSIVPDIILKDRLKQLKNIEFKTAFVVSKIDVLHAVKAKSILMYGFSKENNKTINQNNLTKQIDVNKTVKEKIEITRYKKISKERLEKTLKKFKDQKLYNLSNYYKYCYQDINITEKQEIIIPKHCNMFAYPFYKNDKIISYGKVDRDRIIKLNLMLSSYINNKEFTYDKYKDFTDKIKKNSTKLKEQKRNAFELQNKEKNKTFKKINIENEIVESIDKVLNNDLNNTKQNKQTNKIKEINKTKDINLSNNISNANISNTNKKDDENNITIRLSQYMSKAHNNDVQKKINDYNTIKKANSVIEEKNNNITKTNNVIKAKTKNIKNENNNSIQEHNNTANIKKYNINFKKYNNYIVITLLSIIIILLLFKNNKNVKSGKSKNTNTNQTNTNKNSQNITKKYKKINNISNNTKVTKKNKTKKKKELEDKEIEELIKILTEK